MFLRTAWQSIRAVWPHVYGSLLSSAVTRLLSTAAASAAAAAGNCPVAVKLAKQACKRLLLLVTGSPKLTKQQASTVLGGTLKQCATAVKQTAAAALVLPVWTGGVRSEEEREGWIGGKEVGGEKVKEKEESENKEGKEEKEEEAETLTLRRQLEGQVYGVKAALQLLLQCPAGFVRGESVVHMQTGLVQAERALATAALLLQGKETATSRMAAAAGAAAEGHVSDAGKGCGQMEVDKWPAARKQVSVVELEECLVLCRDALRHLLSPATAPASTALPTGPPAAASAAAAAVAGERQEGKEVEKEGRKVAYEALAASALVHAALIAAGDSGRATEHEGEAVHKPDDSNTTVETKLMKKKEKKRKRKTAIVEGERALDVSSRLMDWTAKAKHSALALLEESMLASTSKLTQQLSAADLLREAAAASWMVERRQCACNGSEESAPLEESAVCGEAGPAHEPAVSQEHSKFAVKLCELCETVLGSLLEEPLLNAAPPPSPPPPPPAAAAAADSVTVTAAAAVPASLQIAPHSDPISGVTVPASSGVAAGSMHSALVPRAVLLRRASQAAAVQAVHTPAPAAARMAAGPAASELAADGDEDKQGKRRGTRQQEGARWMQGGELNDMQAGKDLQASRRAQAVKDSHGEGVRKNARKESNVEGEPWLLLANTQGLSLAAAAVASGLLWSLALTAKAAAKHVVRIGRQDEGSLGMTPPGLSVTAMGQNSAATELATPSRSPCLPTEQDLMHRILVPEPFAVAAPEGTVNECSSRTGGGDSAMSAHGCGSRWWRVVLPPSWKVRAAKLETVAVAGLDVVVRKLLRRSGAEELLGEMDFSGLFHSDWDGVTVLVKRQIADALDKDEIQRVQDLGRGRNVKKEGEDEEVEEQEGEEEEAEGKEEREEEEEGVELEGSNQKVGSGLKGRKDTAMTKQYAAKETTSAEAVGLSAANKVATAMGEEASRDGWDALWGLPIAQLATVFSSTLDHAARSGFGASLGSGKPADTNGGAPAPLTSEKQSHLSSELHLLGHLFSACAASLQLRSYALARSSLVSPPGALSVDLAVAPNGGREDGRDGTGEDTMADGRRGKEEGVCGVPQALFPEPVTRVVGRQLALALSLAQAACRSLSDAVPDHMAPCDWLVGALQYVRAAAASFHLMHPPVPLAAVSASVLVLLEFLATLADVASATCHCNCCAVHTGTRLAAGEVREGGTDDSKRARCYGQGSVAKLGDEGNGEDSSRVRVEEVRGWQQRCEILRSVATGALEAIIASASKRRMAEFLDVVDRSLRGAASPSLAREAVAVLRIALQSSPGGKVIGALVRRLPSLLPNVFAVAYGHTAAFRSSATRAAAGGATTAFEPRHETPFPPSSTTLTSSSAMAMCLSVELEVSCMDTLASIVARSTLLTLTPSDMALVLALPSHVLSSGRLAWVCAAASGCGVVRERLRSAFVGSCQLLCTAVRHRPRLVLRNAVVLCASVRALLHALPVLCTAAAATSTALAAWLARLFEEMGHKRAKLGRYCAYILADYVAAAATSVAAHAAAPLGGGAAGGPAEGSTCSGSISRAGCGLTTMSDLPRQADAALRRGVFALMDACSPQDLQFVHTMLGSGGTRRLVLEKLRDEYRDKYQYGGKV